LTSFELINKEWAIQYWIEQGAPKDKLILGLSFYGRSFKLQYGFESCPITETPVISGGKAGDYTRETGFYAYYEVCEKLQVKNWRYVWNEEQEVPYAYSNEAISTSSMDWVGFDDVKSIENKVKYLMKEKLGGAMIWSIDMDDFNGDFCNQDKYPLLKTVNYYLNKNKDFNHLPNPSVNWAVKSNKTNETLETIHLTKKLEKEFIIIYNQEKFDEESFFRTFNIFKLMKHNSMLIFISLIQHS
jgi:chitinase